MRCCPPQLFIQPGALPTAAQPAVRETLCNQVAIPSTQAPSSLSDCFGNISRQTFVEPWEKPLHAPLFFLRGPLPPRQTFVGLCNQFPAQIVALAAQVSWSGAVLTALNAAQAGSPGGLTACLEGLAWRLLAMSESVLGESPPALRKKYEQLITELVRQRDATRRLKVNFHIYGAV